MTKSSKKEFKCPYCKSKKLSFEDEQRDDLELLESWACDSCEEVFTKVYNLTFLEVQYDI